MSFFKFWRKITCAMHPLVLSNDENPVSRGFSTVCMLFRYNSETMKSGPTLIAAACVLLGAIACNDSESASVRQPFSIRDSASVHILEFTVPLHDLTNTADVQLLEEDIVLGENAEFGGIADVAAFGDGRFAVLDRVDKSITIFDSAGKATREFGREGKGPGEFNYPWAITAVGNRLVAWQWAPTQTFMTFDTDGNILATAGERVSGDWRRYAFRTPSLDTDGDQRGIEDVTRRLVTLDDSTFVHLLQPDEIRLIMNETWDDKVPPPSYMIRYDAQLNILDTLNSLNGARLRVRQDVPREYGPIVRQDFFASVPVVAAGDGWLAVGHGDSSYMNVTVASGRILSSIRFAPRAEVSELDKVRAAEWYHAIVGINIPYVRDRHREMPLDELRQGLRKWTTGQQFEAILPTVTAAYGVGGCLFLAGSSSDDSADGTSLTWIAIDVLRGRVAGIVRLPPHGTRQVPYERYPLQVRDFDGDHVFAVSRDRNGMSRVHRYRLPSFPTGNPSAPPAVLCASA